MPPASALTTLLALTALAAAILLVLLLRSRERVIRLRAELDAARQRADDGQRLVALARDSLKDTFASIGGEVLKNSSEQFLTLAQTHFETRQQNASHELETRKQAIENMLKPVGETLKDMHAKIGEIEKERNTAYSTLAQQIVNIGHTHETLRQETTRLSQALHSRSARGRWGELQLKRVVELAGMLSHCDFSEQATHTRGDTAMRPDLVVHLPGDRSIIVDAKAPMDAYLEALEQEDQTRRQTLMTAHARQVRAHLQQLGSKSYFSGIAQSPDFIVMFLPGESFFQAALEADPALIEYGATQKVIPATPTTLIALLRAVACGWRQEQLARNAEEISRAGADLYDSCITLSEHFGNIGKTLNKSVEHYNKALGSYEKRLIPRAQKLKTLGVTGKRDMPASIPSIDLLAKTAAPGDTHDLTE